MQKSLIITSTLLTLALVGCQFSGTTGNASSSSSSSSVTTADVQVTSLQPGDVVMSPLTVAGQARGTWYFEASFPVTLLDGNGNEIAVAVATASGDWMTMNLVPFTATLSFMQPTTSTGTLVLEKDNPSGDPQNAGKIEIPVQF